MDRLREAVEEKEELLRGLRVTLREVCNDRYPIIQERGELRQQVLDMATVQAKLLEDKEALLVRRPRKSSGVVEGGKKGEVALF